MKTLLKKYGFIVLLLSFLTMAHVAYAESGVDEGEAFGVPSLRDFIQTSVMMEVYDTTNLTVIDEYAKVFYCDLYQQKFKNDFEWNNIRQEILSRINNKREYYRILYQFTVPVSLGRYNFDTQDFPFVNQTALIGIGLMEMLQSRTQDGADFQQRLSPCVDREKISIFPKRYVVKLAESLTLDRLKIPVAASEVFLARLQALNNNSTDRTVYLRFRVKLSAANKVKELKKAKESTGTFVGNITAVDVFLDKELTQFVVNVPLNKE